MWRGAPSLVRAQCSHKLEKIAAADCMAGSEQGQIPRMFGQNYQIAIPSADVV